MAKKQSKQAQHMMSPKQMPMGKKMGSKKGKC
jgi:hypothetical protein